MKCLRSWEDMTPYGINVLTGEACAYGYRLLCDITEGGFELFKSIFGITLTVKNTLPEGWNDHMARSIMLPKVMFEPLAVFALFADNCKRVYITYTGEVYGVEADDSDKDVKNFVKWHQGRFCESCQRYGAGGGINLQYSNPGHSRNRHQMSGRTT